MKGCFLLGCLFRS